MKKLVTGLCGALALCFPTALSAHADLTNAVAATLSCSDGHSVVVTVDQLGLTSLLSDVQAINSGTSGVLCTVDTATADPMVSTDWTVFDYNPSGHAIAPRHSPDSGPATPSNGGTIWSFNFHSSVFTALFTSTDPNLTGNLCPMFTLGCKTLSDSIMLSGDATTFQTQDNGGNCASNFPAAVRFYFTAPSASGSTVGTPTAGTPPAGFYTRFWWSNPVNLPMTDGNQSGTIKADLGDPTMWSDWNGQKASDPSVTEAYMEATQKVQSIGLSFGGECFFETGVTPDPPTDGETFASQFSENP